MKTIHIPCYSISNPLIVLEKNWNKLSGYTNIIVYSTIQHLNKLDGVIGFLNEKGLKSHKGGQVLGCSSDFIKLVDGDCVLYIGSGKFHPLNIAEKTKKPVYILNPISQSFDKVDEDEVACIGKRKKGLIAKAIDSNSYGILISTKSNQFDLDSALKLKERIKNKGKKAYLIVGEELSPTNLLPYDIDMFINTACPRIAEDEFHKPIIDKSLFEKSLEL